ncbi:MAG: hypothetical protein ABI120_15495 [Gemmatimonadaceae bacterium]
MTERRYNEAEVATIFERATQAPPSATPFNSATDGMTLTQLQEIGAEVGISADSIALAATTVEQPAPDAQRTFLGRPLGASRTVQLGRPLTDIEWERLVAELREIFNAPGKLTGYGSLRQWTNGNLQVLLEPTATGQRLRMQTTKADAPAMMITGLGMFSAASAMTIAASAFGALDDKGMLVAMGFLGVVGITMFATTAGRLARWARTRQQQFDVIAARVALTTKDLPPRSEK